MLRLELVALDDHLTAHPPDFAAFRRDCLVELLHQLTLVPAKNRRLADYLAAEPRGYVPLNAQALRTWLPDHKDYLAWALSSKLLECDNHYIVGGPGRPAKSRGYRYAAPFRSGGALAGFRIVRLADAALRERLQRALTAPAPVTWSRAARKDYAPVLDCLRPERCSLRIDTAAALAFIAEERDRVLRDPTLREPKPKKRRRKAGSPKSLQRRKARCQPGEAATTKDPEAQYQQRFASIAQFDARDFRFTIDTYGRLHTVLTRLSSKLRAYVYAEGAPLVALDLRSSQPYLINLLCRPDFYQEPWTKGRRGAHPPLTIWREGRNLADELADEQAEEARWPAASPSAANPRASGRTGRPGRQGEAAKRPSPSYIMLCQQLLGSDYMGVAQFPDVELFRELTSSGQFYAQMGRLLGLAGEGEEVADAAKKLMFGVLFSHNAVESTDKAVFAQHFPTVDAVLRIFKKDDFSYLAKLLQTLESNLFLRRLVPLVRAKWGIPVFTIHDSVVIEASHVDLVETLLREHLTRWVGVPPQFSRKHWGAERRDGSSS
ncbi:hypothetical protein [Hymenobacter antarcticus]|uniref:DNA polymerase family A n=1 Tax=Hymenobacter antarcticus TaxID=486270 RepID=A0ABP7PQV6_9BACT